MVDFALRCRQESKNDEWFTPSSAVEPILPYLKKYKTIWCPFDRYDDKIQSAYVKILKENGHNVIYTHIETGQDFFEYLPAEHIDAIVSNPPYSLRNEVFERLYSLELPFAMLMNYSGLFDNRERYNLFKNKGVQLFVLKGRTKYIKRGQPEQSGSPLFQSIYICRKLLSEQIIFQ